jgi:hypothetical protein
MRMTVDELLIEARGVLPHHPGPAEALAAQAAGALPVDIRGDDQRRPAGWPLGPSCCPATRRSGAAIPRHSGGTRRSTTGPGRSP